MNRKKIPEKSNLVLSWILIALLLIAIRVGYLSILQHDLHLSLARKPQRKSVNVPTVRGMIYDRFGETIATNKVHYAVALRYDRLRTIPSSRWIWDEKGKKERIYPRKSYIARLSQFLSKRLSLDAQLIEDIIYSKASVFPNTPFILKEDLTEREYFSLRYVEKDWPGLETQISSRRFYPQGKMASHLIGYLGAMNEGHFLQIAYERDLLQKRLKEREEGFPTPLPKGFDSFDAVRSRVKSLQEKSYRINDEVGRAGIEKKFDEQLRGDRGKKNVEVDIKGRSKRELPGGVEPMPGKSLSLSLSCQMQKLAEELLIESETLRDENFAKAGKDHDLVPSPWIKGGAIVAMLPHTGEIVAMASYPRFDPNDFILTLGKTPEKVKEVQKWLESEGYISQLWDGVRPMQKEIMGPKKEIQIGEKNLSWEAYLNAVLSPKCAVKKAFEEEPTLEKTLYLLSALTHLQSLADQAKISHLIDALFPEEMGHIPTRMQQSREALDQVRAKITEAGNEVIEEISSTLFSIPHNDDKLLYLDLCRLCIDGRHFSEDLLEAVGSESLTFHRKLSQSLSSLETDLKTHVEPLFGHIAFTRWREENFSHYMNEKRAEEKAKNRYQKPYLDYLQEKQREMFQAFWRENRVALLLYFFSGRKEGAHRDLAPYFDSISAFVKNRLSNPSYRLFQSRLETLPPSLASAYLQSMRSFADLTRPLWGKYTFFKAVGDAALEKHLASAFYPPSGYGHCTSHAYELTAPIGSLFKIVTAYEALRQHYLKTYTSDVSVEALNPLTIIDETYTDEAHPQKKLLGCYIDGKPIARIHRGGRLPKSHRNIGRVELPDAIEQSSNIYFSLLASDILDHPTDLTDAARVFGYGARTGLDLLGEAAGNIPSDVRENRTGLYALAIGQHSLTVTPLQTANMLCALANGGTLLKPQVLQSVTGVQRHILTTSEESSFPYQDLLSNVGIHFPFFHRLQPEYSAPSLWEMKPEALRELFMPQPLRNYLLRSLYRVTNGARGAAGGLRIHYLYGYPKEMRDYLAMQKDMVGKTSTAEVLYRPTLDRETKPIICKHIWFGGISFTSAQENFDHPELVVTVYLRYGDYGKEAAPIAAKLMTKWREIMASNL